MKKLLFILPFILLPLISYGQAERTVMTGIVFAGDSLTPLKNVHVIINSRRFSITNEDGKFSFLASVGDSINFSHIGYKDALIAISDSIIGKNLLAAVYLSFDTLKISEVIIRPRFVNQEGFMRNKYELAREQRNASNNVRLSTYQAKINQPKELDADMHANIAMNKFQGQSMNKGFISQDRMAAVNFLAFIPFLIYSWQEAHKPDPEAFKLTQDEENYLQMMIEARRNEKENNK